MLTKIMHARLDADKNHAWWTTNIWEFWHKSRLLTKIKHDGVNSQCWQKSCILGAKLITYWWQKSVSSNPLFIIFKPQQDVLNNLGFDFLCEVQFSEHKVLSPDSVRTWFRVKLMLLSAQLEIFHSQQVQPNKSDIFRLVLAQYVCVESRMNLHF